MANKNKHLYTALLLALIARLATYPVAGINDPAFFEYGYIASNLIQGNGYATIHWVADSTLVVPSAWMPPGQVLLTAGFFILFGKGALAYHLLFLLNALLGVAAVRVLGKCTKLISHNSKTELVTLYAAALFPPFLSAAASWGVASSALLLNSLLMLSALKLSRSISMQQDQTKHSLQFGLISGILCLFRAEAPIIVAFVMLALLIFHRERWMRASKQLILAGLLMLSILSPWLVINYIRFDELILGSTSGGFNFWRGNNPLASGGGWQSDGKLLMPTRELQREIFPDLHAIEPARFERVYSKRLSQLAVSWIKEHPGSTTLLAAKKALLIWTADLYHPSNIKYVYGAFQLTALLLGIYGLLSLRKRGLTTEHKRWLWIAGAACLATTLLTMVFFSLPRYQMFLVGYYFPLVGIGLHALLKKWGLSKDGNEPSLQG